jgi:hypothetical protein
MKSLLIAVLTVTLLGGILLQSALGQEAYRTENAQPGTTRGDAVLFDMLVLRPLGLIATGLGVVTGAAALPFAVISRSGESTYRGLVTEPLCYTFRRPPGDLNGDCFKGQP